ncbi:MAG: amidohydrolase family protein [Proteobacteria bacterium]|nr:amidohydrolase family protein [Pseudomonadota bacterium]
MAHDILLRNGLVVTPDGERIADIGIDGERIAAIGAPGTLGLARVEHDLTGKVVLPGMFDPHSHLGSGDERDDAGLVKSFGLDTRDAIIGGVTTIATTHVLGRDPLHEMVDVAIEAGTGRSWVDFKISSVLTTYEHMEQIPLAVERGSTSFKMYCGYCFEQAEKMGMRKEGMPPDMFWLAAEQVKKLGTDAHLMIHAEEPHVRRMLAERYEREGQEGLVCWAEHSREWSESVQVYLYGVIAKELDVPMYVVHTSRGHTVDLIERLQGEGYPIISETLVSYLATDAHELESRDMRFMAKIQPPIRYAEDTERLWKGIQDGVVTIIGTDTIPYTSKYKASQPFWGARPGLNIQWIDSLPLLYTHGVNEGRISLSKLAQITSENPARRWGLYPQKGAIAVGSDADLVVVDPDCSMPLGVERMRGSSDYSIWQGRTATAMPVMTFLRGQLAAKDGEVVGEARGLHTPWGREG